MYDESCSHQWLLISDDVTDVAENTKGVLKAVEERIQSVSYECKKSTFHAIYSTAITIIIMVNQVRRKFN